MSAFTDYCEKNNIRFHEKQQVAVMCDDNCTVSAGAGSGKTTVLSYRFLRLVMDGMAKSDEILTITFTRKATTEMRTRIYEHIRNAGLTEELERFRNAQISTVDSFCRSIAVHRCSKYGFSTDFGIEDGDDYAAMLETCAQKVMSTQQAWPLMQTLLSKKSVEDIRDMLVEVATGCWDITRTFDPDDMLDRMKKDCSQRLDGIAKHAREMRDQYEKLVEEDDPKLAPNLKALDDWLERGVSTGKWNGLELNKRIGSKSVKASSNLLVDCLRILAEKACFASCWDQSYLMAGYRLTAMFLEEVALQKRERGKLTFGDIMQMTLETLIEDKALRNSYKRRFKYIMIDEFQDNNDDYRKLLYLLSERQDICVPRIPEVTELQSGKIFLVGDEKQSIYRFRGADVTVFKKIATDLEKAGGKALELSVNFRSEPELLEGFNSLFANAMANPDHKLFEADFRSLGTRSSNGIASKAVYHYCVPLDRSGMTLEEEMAEDSQNEAAGLASLIQRMTTTDDFEVYDKSKKGKRRPRYSDIAILFRAIGRQSAYEKALLKEGIPYTVGNAKSLVSEALFNDFLCILEQIAYPFERTSLAAALRSPLCNITEASVCKVLKGKQEELSDEQARRYAAFSEDMAKLRGIASGGSICNVLMFIWYDMGYRMFMTSNPANQVYAEHFDYLYELAAQYDRDPQKGLVDYVEYMRALESGEISKFKDSVEVYREGSTGVKLMTIHASKGLEFPIVIIAEMQNGERRSSKPSSVTGTGGFVCLPCVEDDGHWHNPIYRLEEDNERAYEDAETRRIFYVAATRAEDHIVFSGTHKGKKHPNLTMMDMLDEATGFDYESGKCSENSTYSVIPIKFTELSLEQTYSVQKLEEDIFSGFEETYAQAPEDDNLKWSSGRTAVTDEEVEGLEEEGTRLRSLACDSVIRENNLQKEFGTYVHALLEGSALGEMQPDTSFTDGLPESARGYVLEEGQRMRDDFLASDMGRKVTDGSFKLYPERAFVMKDGDCLVDGVIDLLCVSDNEVLIIDFKTDSIARPQIHRHQLETYANAVRQAYPGREVKAFVVYLRDCSVVAQIV